MPSPGIKRAVIDRVDIDTVLDLKLDSTLRSRERQQIPPGETWFTVLEGAQRAIVTAPHATRPFRDGVSRFSDGGGTAELAVALHKVCGVTVMHTTWDSPSDPNYYDDNDFKLRLRDLIRDKTPVIVLDLHGSHAYRPYELDVGTMNGRSLLGRTALVNALVDAFRREGIFNISDNFFPAARQQTVVKFASAAGVPAIQMELSALRVSPSSGDEGAHKFAQTLQAIAEFLGGLQACSRTNH
ncbi:MAG: ketol-acid reductoisomerase [Cytophagaceae bacterium]|nr:ketol-acid reductoisomerase [Gemmatimonadaceae bacterium]